MADIHRVVLDLENFGKDTPKVMSKLLRRAAFDLMAALEKGSPVDTGRFRASWFVGVGRKNHAVQPVGTYGKGVSNARVDELSPASVTGYEPIILSNNLPYGPALADGHSRKAASGWIELAVAYVRARMAVLKVKE